MNHKQYVKSIMTRDSEGQHNLMYSRPTEQAQISPWIAFGTLLLFKSLTQMIIIPPFPFKSQGIAQLDAF